jgi:hypothetical protein
VPTQSQLMAMQRMIEASASLEVQFDRDASRRPVLFLLKKAREAAVAAFDALVYSCDPADAATVRQLQHEIRRYDDLVDWCREIISEGKEADRQLTEIERAEFVRAVLDPENAEVMRAAGASQEDIYADR